MKMLSVNFWHIIDIAEKEEKNELREKIIEATQVAYPTYYSWLRRRIVPKWHRQKIAEVVATFWGEKSQINPEEIEVQF